MGTITSIPSTVSRNVLRDRSTDLNGNTLSYHPIGTATAQTLVYDARNRLAQITPTAGQTWGYAYTGAGERVRKLQTAGGTGVRYLIYSGPDLLGDYNQNGPGTSGANQRSRGQRSRGHPVNTVVLVGVQILLNEPARHRIDAITDANSVLRDRTTDANGNTLSLFPVLDKNCWTPINPVLSAGRYLMGVQKFDCEVLADEDPDSNLISYSFPLRFPGQYRDSESGSHYNYFRDYEAGTGRYVESDPIGLERGASSFGYALQNPAVLFDPHGLKAWYCYRPLCNRSGTKCTTGERGVTFFNHHYLCATRADGSIECGGQSSNSPGPLQSSGRPTRPDEDEFNEKSCVRVDGDENRCLEACLLGQFPKSRPIDAYPGPQGTDCQEWAWEQLDYCRKQCQKASDSRKFVDR